MDLRAGQAPERVGHIHTRVVRGEEVEEGRGHCMVGKHHRPVVAVGPMAGGSCCSPWSV